MADLDLIDHKPRSYVEAIKHKNRIEAMNQEIKALEENSTWELSALPVGKKAIRSKWVFRVKKNSNGSIQGIKLG